MKKVNDERIELQRLKNIRLAFMIQSAGIIGILVYYLLTEGIMEFAKNPLWMLLMLVIVILNYQNLLIADEVEDKITTFGSYWRILLIGLAIGVVTTWLAYLFPGKNPANPFLVGGIVTLCFLVPFSIVHYLLEKRYENKLD